MEVQHEPGDAVVFGVEGHHEVVDEVMVLCVDDEAAVVMLDACLQDDARVNPEFT